MTEYSPQLPLKQQQRLTNFLQQGTVEQNTLVSFKRGEFSKCRNKKRVCIRSAGLRLEGKNSHGSNTVRRGKQTNKKNRITVLKISRNHPVESFIFQIRKVRTREISWLARKYQCCNKVPVPVLSVSLTQVQFYFTMSLYYNLAFPFSSFLYLSIFFLTKEYTSRDTVI